MILSSKMISPKRNQPFQSIFGILDIFPERVKYYVQAAKVSLPLHVEINDVRHCSPNDNRIPSACKKFGWFRFWVT